MTGSVVRPRRALLGCPPTSHSRRRDSLALSFSGDALNAAAASAAAGAARTLLAAGSGEDEIGSRLLRYAEEPRRRDTAVRRGPNRPVPTWSGPTPRDAATSSTCGRVGGDLGHDARRPGPGPRIERAAVLLVGRDRDGLVAQHRRHGGRGRPPRGAAGGRSSTTPTTAAAGHHRQARAHLRLVPWLTVAVPSAPSRHAQPLVDTADPLSAARRLLELGAARCW